MSRDNLERVLDKANDADWEIASQAWFRYHKIVSTIAKRHGFDARTGAAVFSALSPNSDYLGNIRDTNRLLQAARAGMRLEDFKVSTYGNNKKKAWRIAYGEEPLDLIVFPKTRNFFLNVADPTDPFPVTVDGHIFNAWSGVRRKLNSADMKGYAKSYHVVADTIREIGADRKIIPNVVQGLIWYCWKRTHRIKHSSQQTFWEDDCFAAGLGLITCEDFSRSLDEMVGTAGVAPEPLPCHGSALLSELRPHVVKA